MAIKISVAMRCKGCITSHTMAAVKHGASREKRLETIGVGTYMGGGRSYVYGAQALEAFGQFAAA